jgi:hypothetical protein
MCNERGVHDFQVEQLLTPEVIERIPMLEAEACLQLT